MPLEECQAGPILLETTSAGGIAAAGAQTNATVENPARRLSHDFDPVVGFDGRRLKAMLHPRCRLRKQRRC